jgi:hypothetical protein
VPSSPLAFFTCRCSPRPPPAPPPLIRSGPGCSSLGGGFMSELGPFFPHEKVGLGGAGAFCLGSFDWGVWACLASWLRWELQRAVA